MLGSIRGNDLAVKTLLDLGADPNLQDYEGNTALHFACAYNQSNLIDILLTKCATDILNNKHQKPI
jgi:ankyrin repeat protein